MSVALVREIDHFLCKVKDTDLAADAFESAGFNTTPLSQLKGLGVQNRLVAFDAPQPGCTNFIELLSVYEPAEVKPSMHELLRHGDGIRSLILSGPDICSAAQVFAEQGYPFGSRVDVERD